MEERYQAALNCGAEHKEIINEEVICNLNVNFLGFY